MQLRPFRFLWRQFCGPQITAIMTAVYKWFTDTFNANIRYLSTISIDTATDAHLTLFGACQGIRRPIVVLADSSHFIFTYEPEHDKDYGVSEIGGSVGGRFTDLDEDRRRKKAVLCPEVFYRAILQAKRDVEGNGSSMAFLTKMLTNCWRSVGNTEPPVFRISYFTSEDIPYQHTYGDIRVDMGPLIQWGENREVALQWQSVLSEVFNALMNPNSYIEFVFSAD